MTEGAFVAGYIGWLKQKSTRELIAVLSPVAVAAVGGAWILYTHFYPSPTPEIVTRTEAPKPAVPATVQPAVEADHGSVAIGGNVANSSIAPNTSANHRK